MKTQIAVDRKELSTDAADDGSAVRIGRNQSAQFIEGVDWPKFTSNEVLATTLQIEVFGEAQPQGDFDEFSGSTRAMLWRACRMLQQFRTACEIVEKRDAEQREKSLIERGERVGLGRGEEFVRAFCETNAYKVAQEIIAKKEAEEKAGEKSARRRSRTSRKAVRRG